MSPAELNPFQLMQRVAAFLEAHAIAYRVVGSLASMAYGEPRFTNDIDILADLRPEHCGRFLAAFPPPDHYLSDAAMRTAIEHPGQFNIIHLPSGIKVDMIVLKPDAYAQTEIQRGRRLTSPGEFDAWFASPEDVILNKLRYYAEGGSEKHLRDIASILLIQSTAIDLDYNATFDSDAHAMTLSGVISGAGEFEKTGSGSVTLSGANTFSGGLTVTAGTLATSAGSRLASTLAPSVASGATVSLGGDQTLAVVTGSGTLDIQGGTVALGAGGSFASASSLQLATGTILDLAGNSQAFAGVTGTGGTIALGSGALTVSGAGSFGGVISGTGSLTKNGTGDLVLGGANTYDGSTTVSGGRLSVNGSLASLALTVSGGLCGRHDDLRAVQLLGHLERRAVDLQRHAPGRRQPV